jgi:hypothetical protein
MANLVALTVEPRSAPELERDMHAALAAAGVEPGALWSYEGPPPGTFAFGDGLLKFLSDGLAQLAKVPNALEALCRGIAGWMVKQRLSADVRVEPGGAVNIRFRASGKDLDVEATVAELAGALRAAART